MDLNDIVDLPGSVPTHRGAEKRDRAETDVHLTPQSTQVLKRKWILITKSFLWGALGGVKVQWNQYKWFTTGSHQFDATT